tara:strand:- start:62 stop:622 length:561 start_codon:yes stop_codon:yes gene_type:complete
MRINKALFNQKINKDHTIEFVLASDPYWYDSFPYLESNWEEVSYAVNNGDSAGLLTSLEELGINESEISVKKLIETIINKCETVCDENGNDQFKYPVFGNWVLDHYNESYGYYGSDERGLETCFEAIFLQLYIMDNNIMEDGKNKCVYFTEEPDECEIRKMDRSQLKLKYPSLNLPILEEYISHAT